MNKKDFEENGMSFQSYYDLFENLVKEKTSTGDNPSQGLIDFTKLNFSRTKRILKTTNISDSQAQNFKDLKCKRNWMVITEPWCGDSASILPVIHKLSELSNSIDFRIVLRDEHPEVMDIYLTNGSRSIPKMVCFDEEMKEIGTWGARPTELTKLVQTLKNDPEISKEEMQIRIQKWYNEDDGQSIIEEFIVNLDSCEEL